MRLEYVLVIFMDSMGLVISDNPEFKWFLIFVVLNFCGLGLHHLLVGLLVVQGQLW